MIGKFIDSLREKPVTCSKRILYKQERQVRHFIPSLSDNSQHKSDILEPFVIFFALRLIDACMKNRIIAQKIIFRRERAFFICHKINIIQRNILFGDDLRELGKYICHLILQIPGNTPCIACIECYRFNPL